MQTIEINAIPYGTLIHQEDHPEYGTFVTGDRTEHNGCVWCSVRNRSGVTVMHATDFARHWRVGKSPLGW